MEAQGRVTNTDKQGHIDSYSKGLEGMVTELSCDSVWVGAFQKVLTMLTSGMLQFPYFYCGSNSRNQQTVLVFIVIK